MNSRITAPMVALMMEARIPPPIMMPSAPSTQVPIKAPTPSSERTTCLLYVGCASPRYRMNGFAALFLGVVLLGSAHAPPPQVLLGPW